MLLRHYMPSQERHVILFLARPPCNQRNDLVIFLSTTPNHDQVTRIWCIT